MCTCQVYTCCGAVLDPVSDVGMTPVSVWQAGVVVLVESCTYTSNPQNILKKIQC